MTQLVKKEPYPEELINELEKRAYGETALVIMSMYNLRYTQKGG